jgi:hypothetical protein
MKPDNSIKSAGLATSTPQENISNEQTADHTTTAEWLRKLLNLNDWLHPETTEQRIYGAAQFVMDMLDDPDKYRTLSWLSLKDNSAFWLYTYWANNLPFGLFTAIIKLQGQEDTYRKLLWLIQNQTKNIFKQYDKGNYTKNSEEFRITKVKKGLVELNQHRSDSEFNKEYNDWMYNILYLLHESFGNEYYKKYGDYYRTDEQKKEVEAMKDKHVTIK